MLSEISRGQLGVTRTKTELCVCEYVYVYKAPVEGALYTHTYGHYGLFSYRYRGCFTMETSQSPSIEGASLWGLHETPIERAFAMAAF